MLAVLMVTVHLDKTTALVLYGSAKREAWTLVSFPNSATFKETNNQEIKSFKHYTRKGRLGRNTFSQFFNRKRSHISRIKRDDHG
jgi:hypothetical protein